MIAPDAVLSGIVGNTISSVYQPVAGQDPLLYDLELLGGLGAHGRGRQRVGNLLAFYNQPCLGQVDRRQDARHRHPHCGAEGQEDQEIRQAPQEQ
jgi:hypothetical protein